MLCPCLDGMRKGTPGRIEEVNRWRRADHLEQKQWELTDVTAIVNKDSTSSGSLKAGEMADSRWDSRGGCWSRYSIHGESPVYTWVHMCMHTRTCVHGCICICVVVHVWICTHMCALVCMHMCLCEYVCVRKRQTKNASPGGCWAGERWRPFPLPLAQSLKSKDFVNIQSLLDIPTVKPLTMNGSQLS